MPTRITHVSPGSIADRLGLRAGDQLVSIAGEPERPDLDYGWCEHSARRCTRPETIAASARHRGTALVEYRHNIRRK